MIKIIYWSGSGNTEDMANYIQQGLQEAGKEVEIKQVSEVTLEDATACELLILGCPAMGAEELEESEMEPFVENLNGQVTGKKIALFGSYGWGDGEWMTEWEDRMLSYKAHMVAEPLIINGTPEGADEEECIKYGKEIAQSV